MRKFVFSVAAAAMLFTACSEENSMTSMEGASDVVTVGIELPNEMGTRAGVTVPENHTLHCYMAIYDENGAQVGDNYETILIDGALSFAIELEDGDYSALLWADYTFEGGSMRTSYYETRDLKEVRTYMPAEKPEYKEAFYGKIDFTKEPAGLKLSTTLSRAVARLSFVEKEADSYNYISTFSAVYDKACSFDVSTGTASNRRSTKLMDAVPTGTVESTGTELFYDYVLAGANDMMDEVFFSFVSNDDATVINDITIPAGIPVVANRKTIVTGPLAQPADAPSKTVDVDVELSDAWEGINNAEVVVGEVVMPVITQFDVIPTDANGYYNFVLNCNKDIYSLYYIFVEDEIPGLTAQKLVDETHSASVKLDSGASMSAKPIELPYTRNLSKSIPNSEFWAYIVVKDRYGVFSEIVAKKITKN